jgi:DNA repair exonuclease SbcCD ATPase subunit
MYNARQFLPASGEESVDQAELEIQLQVWKDLAISKQVLIGAATDALGLDPDCDTDQLKAALDKAIKRSMEADANIEETREQARVAVEVMEQKVKDSAQVAEDAMEERDKAIADVEAMENQINAARAANAEEVKKVKKQLAEEQKKLKAINVSLADTPENVIKKLKALKKQKGDESTARKRAEDATRAARKEKQALEQKLESIEAAIKDSAELAKSFRELHEASMKMKYLLKEAEDLPTLPMLNEKQLERIEEAASSLEDK